MLKSVGVISKRLMTTKRHKRRSGRKKARGSRKASVNQPFWSRCGRARLERFPTGRAAYKRLKARPAGFAMPIFLERRRFSFLSLLGSICAVQKLSVFSAFCCFLFKVCMVCNALSVLDSLFCTSYLPIEVQAEKSVACAKRTASHSAVVLWRPLRWSRAYS